MWWLADRRAGTDTSKGPDCTALALRHTVSQIGMAQPGREKSSAEGIPSACAVNNDCCQCGGLNSLDTAACQAAARPAFDYRSGHMMKEGLKKIMVFLVRP